MDKIDIEKISEGNHKAYSELIETLEKVKDAIKKQNYGIAMDILCKPYPAFQVITLSSESKDEPNVVVVIPKFRVGDVIRPKGSTAEYTIESISGECYHGKGWGLHISCDDDYELVEQNPADNAEPKFKVGDWVVWDNKIFCHVDNIYQGKNSLMYTITDTNNMTRSYSVKGFDNNAHLWTIQDAKDGDVLVCESGWTCIFKTLVNDETFSSYCFMDNTKWFCETGSECHTLKEEFVKAYNGKIYPATKEQRDLLFKKMHEAGYEWDADKKELKKIDNEEFNGEDYGIDSLYHAQRILENTLGKVDGYQTDDGILAHKCAISAVKQLAKQKPTWSEEDERNLEFVIRQLRIITDEKHFAPVTNWLKSLKDIYTWKPSGEQIKALEAMLTVSPQSPAITSALLGLYEQLKKLREE